MIRKAFVIHARPGKLGEYIKNHNPVWPELQAVLTKHGVSNYTIFHRPQSAQLFGYLEVRDEELFQQLASEDVCKRWWKFMTSFLECENEESQKAKEEILKEIFHQK